MFFKLASSNATVNEAQLQRDVLGHVQKLTNMGEEITKLLAFPKLLQLNDIFFAANHSDSTASLLPRIAYRIGLPMRPEFLAFL